MKKTILIMIFTFASFMMNAKGSLSPENPENCYEYAAVSADTEEAFYGPMCSYDWNDAAFDYYDSCVEAGGVEFTLDPVFI